MSYDATVAQPIALTPRTGGSGPVIWAYTSTDAHGSVDAADYFSNGHALGMKVGDIVLVSKSTATIGTTIHYVSTVTAGGAATIEAAIFS